MKIKELKKLSQEVQRACLFAEEIKSKVTNDLHTITELDAFVQDVKQTVLTLEEKLTSANQVLGKLDELLS